MKEFNKWDGEYYTLTKHLPSLNQISAGLIAEAIVQLKLAMGNIKDQKSALEAQENIRKTWEDLLSKAQIEDREAILESGADYVNDGDDDKPLGLTDPNNPVVAVCNYIY